MVNNNHILISTRYKQLPEDTQKKVVSVEIARSIVGAMNLVNIKDSDRNECNKNILMVMIGLSTTQNFNEYVEKKLGLDVEKTQSFKKLIDDEVFSKIRSSLLSSYKEKKGVGGEVKNTNNDPYREPVEHNK